MFLLHLIHPHLTDPEVYFQQENIDVKLPTAFAEFSIIDTCHIRHARNPTYKLSSPR